jgi:DNA polymerase
MLVTYALDDAPAQCWDRTTDNTFPRDLASSLDDSEIEIWCHNSFFDRTMLNNATELPLFFDLSIHRFRCTMVQAFEHGLPGALGKLGAILGLPEETQKREGRDLIHLFCKPRPKNSKLRRATRHTHPAEWQDFKEYAIRDTEALREIGKRLPSWNYPDNQDELELWFLDQEINDRGVAFDLELAHAAVRATQREKKRLAEETKEQTDDHVQAATQRDKLLAFLLMEYGVNLPDMRAATLERRIEDPELPEALKELLRVRLESSQTSQSKYKKALNAVSPDGRIRGMMQWCGAQRTGRNAGRIFNPLNLPRPKLKQHVIEEGIAALKLGVEDLICA